MTCPRCNTEWDVSKSPCPRCGLRVHLPPRRTNTPSERGNPLPQMPRTPQPSQDGYSAFTGQQSGGMSSLNSRASENSATIHPSPEMRSQQSGRLSSVRPENRAFPPQSSNPQMPVTPYPSRIPPNVQRVDAGREGVEHFQPSSPAQQWNGTEESSTPSMKNTLPNMPRSENKVPSDYENNPFLARLRRNDTQEPGSAVVPTTDRARGDSPAPPNVPRRPSVSSPLNRSTENLLPDAQRSIRPSRLVTDALARESQRRSIPPTPTGTNAFQSKDTPKVELPQLMPGTLLRGGRYRLRELAERQEWLEGVYEATWVAQDAQRAGSQVMIRELVIPDSKSIVMQSTLRNATMALTSVGRHPHIPTLWDAFSDQGRNFFVFEPIEGESLAARMRRTGRALAEQDVIECCLQMTEILEILVQQSPPLIHGLIQPEHIIIGRTSSDYILTNFSIILAGGATQYVSGIDRSHVTPYTAPEFIRGSIDGRSDLYALLATAYHAVTGSLPVNAGISIPQAQRLNPTISSAFDGILTRGLRPTVSQRYQRPSELRHDLLTMHSVNSTVNTIPSTEPDIARSERPVSIQTPLSSQPISSEHGVETVLPSIMQSSSLFDNQEQRLLLPRPEELPPMPERNDVQLAVFWLIGILMCLIVIIAVSRGFM